MYLLGGGNLKRLSRILGFLFIFIYTLSFTSFASEPTPSISGTSAITYDIDTNEIIYVKNIDDKLYPASVTKLITALILAENMSKDSKLTYSKEAKYQEPVTYSSNIRNIPIGDTMYAKDLMDALLLKSCNDLAYMIAENVGGSEKGFSDMMNSKAKELGMTNTNFVTPNGLDTNIDNHYSTAYDLALMTKAAFNNSWVKETLNKERSVVKTSKTPNMTVKNSNKLLGVDGCIGGKTGFTTKAGRCLSEIYERDGRHIVGIILNSENDFPYDKRIFNDMEKIINWSYSAGKELFISKNTIIDKTSIKFRPIPFIRLEKPIDIPIEVREDISLYNNGLPVEKTITINNINPWTLDSDAPIGTLTITQRDYIQTYNLYTSISKEDLISEGLLNCIKDIVVNQ